MQATIGVIVQIFGWVGVGAMLGAYHLVATGKIAPDSLKYHALNVCGGGLLALCCLWTQAWPSMVANAIFVIIGMHVVATTKRENVISTLRSYRNGRRN